MVENLGDYWPLFLLAAMLYASIGHGGASSYLAIMVWISWPIEEIRAQALMLNLVVSLTGTILFFRSGNFRIKLFLPLVLTSIPLAWVGGSMRLPTYLYEGLLAFGLFFAAVRLLYKPKSDETNESQVGVLMLVGALIGWVSGMIGIGGGIFLTPVLILAKWATPKEAAALSAPFIFVNSASGLLGVFQSGYSWSSLTWGLVPAVAIGGLLGAWWGSRHANPKQLRYALSLVLMVASLKLVIV